MMTKNKDWQDEVALQRYTMITPLLSEDLDNAKRIAMREKIAQDNFTTARSLYRYEKAYRENGFQGLRPTDRQKRRSQALPENFDELLNEAIQLRREVPERSVEQLILILELEGRVAPGVLKRSTLERHLYNAGFGSEHLRTYKDARESSSKRFCKPHRMMLIQGDIKYGPLLPIGKRGAKVKTYLSSAIDDHSRFVIASKFYASQEEEVVEDTFRSVLLRAGAFDRCYFDNGSQYIAKQLKLSLAKLGISISHAPVRSGKSKGKIEKFHQVVDAFVRESKLKNVRSLDELNRLWSIYLEDQYHNDPHAGIAEYYQCLNADVPPEGITPRQEWNRDTRPLNFIDVNTIAGHSVSICDDVCGIINMLLSLGVQLVCHRHVLLIVVRHPMIKFRADIPRPAAKFQNVFDDSFRQQNFGRFIQFVLDNPFAERRYAVRLPRPSLFT